VDLADERTPMSSAEKLHPDVPDVGACTLTAWIFDEASEAEAVAQGLAAGPTTSAGVDDAAVVRWDPDEPRPRLRRFAALASDDALGEDFWALVLGITFQVPLLGAAVAGVAGAAAGSLSAAGIDERFMNRLRDELTPGRSALLVLGPRAGSGAHDPGPGLARPEVVVAALSALQVAALREVFGT
jgi:uncharacterized membrane protein